jgi:choline dehydrogenase-like flavoprotein
VNDRHVIVVGSGPSGAQAAKRAVDDGLFVTMVDVGIDDERTRGLIPSGSFEELRRTDPDQYRYFVGEISNETALSGVRVGAQLTPPRAFAVRDAEKLAPMDNHGFHPMRSFALGGLGAAWGTGCYTYNDDELARAGLAGAPMRPFYDEVAADIGICGATDDDTAVEFLECSPIQPPQPLDTNAKALLDTYLKRRKRINELGVLLGRSPLAMLSEPLERDGVRREANTFDDMDFYSDQTRSSYRPRYTIEELKRRENFRYLGGTLALAFREAGDGVRLACRDVSTGTTFDLEARTLILACGAMGTTTLVLRSLERFDERVPLLSNPYTYIPAINLPMLGRPAASRRHSGAQLNGVLKPTELPSDTALLTIFSYRSLLLFKLVKEMPLPPSLGLLTARLLQTALTIVGIFHPERTSPRKWMALRRGGEDGILETSYALGNDEQRELRSHVLQTARALAALRCIPFGAIDPGSGSSIHYAGGLRITDDARETLGTSASGRLHAAPNVYVADSANWLWLPGKGPTLTLMAAARRVASTVAGALRS